MNWTPTPEQLEAITGASRVGDFGQPKVILGLPDPDYRKIGAVSNSFLKRMEPTPGHACSFFDQEDKPHFRIGRLVHQQILTPDIPIQEIAVYPETYIPSPKSTAKTDSSGAAKWNMNSHDCQRWEAQQIAAGRTCFKRDEHDITMGCIRSLALNETSRGMLAAGNAEVTVVEKLCVRGVEFAAKARLDWVPKSGTALVDVKTVLRGGGCAREFTKQVKWEGYGMQAAWYLNLWNDANPNDQRTEFVWIVVEKGAPFAVSFYYLNEFGLQEYQRQVAERLTQFAHSIRDGLFAVDNNTFQLAA